MNKVRTFSLLSYVTAALAQADYAPDEDGVVIAQVLGAPGFFAQGDTFEEARTNLRDAIEGTVMVALQLGWSIPAIEGIVIEEQDAEAIPA
jgi:predicted RNase H-like HicB family nuclease